MFVNTKSGPTNSRGGWRLPVITSKLTGELTSAAQVMCAGSKRNGSVCRRDGSRGAGIDIVGASHVINYELPPEIVISFTASGGGKTGFTGISYSHTITMISITTKIKGQGP